MSETQAVKPNKMNIAVMVPTLSHSVEYSFTLGLQSCLPVDQYNIIYLPLGWIDANNAGNGQAALLHKALRFSDLHGILIYGAGITNRVKPEYISEITDCYPNVPIINIGNRIPDLASVIIDNRTPFRQFAYHLVKNKGCSRIAFVRGPDDNYDANERYAGFKEGLMECGQSLNPAYDWPGQFSIGSGSLAVQHHFFKADQPPQAIVCANDLSAIGVLTQLIEMGVKVPEDCLVIGFDDLDYSKVIPVPLSSGRYPVFDLGAVAAKLLIDWLQGSAPAAITEISSSVIFRQSTDDDGDPRSQLALLLKDERAFYSRDSNSDRLHINRAISRGASINATLPKIAANIIDVGCVRMYFFSYDLDTTTLSDILLIDGDRISHLDKNHSFYSQLSLSTLFSEINYPHHNWVLSPVQSDSQLFGFVVTVIAPHESDFAEFIANEFSKKSESILLARETEYLKNQVLQIEQMATLGRLVSGLAHELNTPLGISLVAATNLSDEIRTIRRLDQERTLTKSSFQEFLDTCDETQNILYSSLKRTADLVSSFKKVSVDQHVDEKRKVNLCEYLDDVLLSLGPQLKRSKVTIETQFPTKIVTTTSPGLWAQLVTNLVLNAIIHGFDDGTSDGNVYVRLHMQKKLIELSVVDNGVGIPAEKLRHIFEPFYTTRRAKGGTGLGLHIVYNLVTQKLLGHITVTSRHKSQYGEHSGTTFVIQVPFAL